VGGANLGGKEFSTRCHPTKWASSLILAVAMAAAWSQPLSPEYIHRIGNIYAIDCSRTDSPRVRVSVQSFDIEIGNKRMRAMHPQDISLGMWGKNAPPDGFEGAFVGTVQPDVTVLFNLSRDKVGQYFTIEGHPKVEAALGKALLKQRFRRCS
jgi:hypothetical protein